MRSLIIANNLCRQFKNYEKRQGLKASLSGFFKRQHKLVYALRPTTLELEAGKIFGLVGANGAGKTTLMKLLSGLIPPTAGTATVLGFVPWQREAKFLRQISLLLGQKNQLWWDLTPQDSFSLLIDIYELPAETAKKRVLKLAAMLDCQNRLNTQLRLLSLGERMKMELIGAFLHEPRVIFLDEPTIGLDVVAQRSIRDFLSAEVARTKPTVLLTSHYMDDISILADRLLLMSQGEIVYDGTVKEFQEKEAGLVGLYVVYDAPLVQTIELAQDVLLLAGQNQHQIKIPPHLTSTVMPQIFSAGKVLDFKLTEVDFEESMRKFLAHTAGLHATGHQKCAGISA